MPFRDIYSDEKTSDGILLYFLFRQLLVSLSLDIYVLISNTLLSLSVIYYGQS